MSSINFDNPYLLLLAVPLVVLFAIPFFIAIRKDNVNGHNIASGIIHVVMAIIVAFAAAGTSIVTTMTETDVYVLADVSYSANRNYDLIDDYIEKLGDSLPDNSRLGVICFGKDYQLLSRLGETPKSVSLSTVDDSATDIVGALDFAGSLFRESVLKHIVVITDGKQSDESDSNALKRQVDALADKKIHVSAIYLDDNLPEGVREVQLSSVEISDNAYLNRQQNVTLTIKCNCPDFTENGGVQEPYNTEAILRMYREGTQVAERTVYLTNGDNFETFSLSTSEAGEFDYEFRIMPTEDTNPNNNSLIFTQRVSAGAEVLLITDDAGNYDKVQKIFGDSAVIDAYVNIPNVPCTVEQLCRYDEIVLADVDPTKLSNSTMLLESIDTVVSLFGKSLVTLGNVNVQNYPSGELRQLDNMLPVVFGKREDAPKLYTIIVDTSRSMFSASKFARAKQAASEIVNLLSDSDYLNLIEFSGNAYTLHTTALMEDSRQDVLDTIDSLTVSQGTSIGSGLQAAFNIMSGDTVYGEKRVMLITDGLNFTEDNYDPEEIVQNMRDYGIYTSVLDVGRGGDAGAEATQARTLLNNIVTIGGGQYLDISSEDSLESVIDTQLPSDVNNPNGGRSYISVNRRVDEVLSGINQSELGSTFVMDYYYGLAKASATTVLTVDFSLSSSNVQKAPLYAYWNYGNGKVATFTSSVSDTQNWLSYWSDELATTFISNMFETSVPSEKVDYPFLLDITTENGYAHVTLTPATVDMDVEATISVTCPDGSEIVGSMAFGSRTFDYQFVTSDVGTYSVEVTYDYGGGGEDAASDKVFTVDRSVSVSYAPEYDSFALFDAAVLHKMVGSNGVVSEDGNLTIENEEGEAGVYNLPLAMPLLIAAVALFAIDIGVRKLKWDDIKSLFKKVNK